MPITNRQIKEARENIQRLLKGEPLLKKKAFVPMDQNGMVQPPQPMQGMPQGAPPPAAAGMPPGPPPGDPNAGGGGAPPPPPGDSNAGGGAPPPGGDPNAGLPIIQMTANDLMQFVQELMSMGMGPGGPAGANEGGKPKGGKQQALEGKLDDLAAKVDSLVQTMSGGMGMPQGGMGMPMGDPASAAIPQGAEPMVPDMSGAMGSGMPPKTANAKSPARALQNMIARMKK